MDREKPQGKERDDRMIRPKTETDPILGEAVGSQLKALFDEFASEQVPDKFFDLIDRLEKSEAEQNLDKPTHDKKSGVSE